MDLDAAQKARAIAQALPVATPRVAELPPRQVVARRIARFLRFMRGHIVPAAMLIDYVYSGRPSHQPRHPRQSIAITMCRLRRAGYPIMAVRTRDAFVWDERLFAELRIKKRRGP